MGSVGGTVRYAELAGTQVSFIVVNYEGGIVSTGSISVKMRICGSRPGSCNMDGTSVPVDECGYHRYFVTVDDALL